MTTTEKDDDKGRTETPPDIENDDLDLIDNALEDESKDDAEIWAEIDQEEAGAEAGAAPESDSGADDGEVPAGAEAKTDDDDAGQTGDEPKPDGDKPSGDAGDAGEDDPWSTATDEQRAAYDAAQEQLKKLEQSDRSNRGRLAAMQRQINELNTKPPAPKGDGEEGVDGDGEDDDEIKSVVDEYPEVAKPLLKKINSLEAKLSKHDQKLTAADESRHDEEIDEQTDLLEKDYPDWEDDIAAEGFEDWLYAQPRHIQEAAVRNAEEIVDAAEAADVVGRWKAFRSAQGNTGDDPGAEDLDAGKTGDGDGKPRLSGKRQRQLESAAGTQKGGPGVAHGIPEDGDPEAIWNAFDKVEQRQAQRA